MSSSLPACGAPSPAEPQPFDDTLAGNLADFEIGALRQVPAAPAFIGRDAGGLYAMTSSCTHEGCAVFAVGVTSDAGLHCPCHGASFDGNGRVLRGPAEADLTHFAVELGADGSITVRGRVHVSAAERTPVV